MLDSEKKKKEWSTSCCGCFCNPCKPRQHSLFCWLPLIKPRAFSMHTRKHSQHPLNKMASRMVALDSTETMHAVKGIQNAIGNPTQTTFPLVQACISLQTNKSSVHLLEQFDPKNKAIHAPQCTINVEFPVLQDIICVLDQIIFLGCSKRNILLSFAHSIHSCPLQTFKKAFMSKEILTVFVPLDNATTNFSVSLLPADLNGSLGRTNGPFA